MVRTRILKLTALAFAALAFISCSKRDATVAPASSSLLPVGQAKLPASNDTIRFLENRVKLDPQDFIALNKLASEYLQQLRETGNITYLELASRAARSSLAVLPAEQNKGGLVALTQTEFASHNFANARDHALHLTRLDPNKGYIYLMLGDALLELGQYDEAGTAFKQMEEFGGIQTLTQVAMEQRLARFAMLNGDNKGSERHFSAALKLVQTMPEPPRETFAWCQWQLGEAAFAVGDYKVAQNYYRDALKTYPDHFPVVASLGRVRAALGDLPDAIEQYEKVVRIVPDPNFVAALGDLYQLSGREEDARKQYELVEQISNLSELNGSLYNRQLALFYADHDLKPDEAYSLAAKEYEVRQDIYGADAVAWTALKAGKLAEAQSVIKEALRLGTKDAKLYYHAAMILKAANDPNEAHKYFQLAFKLNPQFQPLFANSLKNEVGGRQIF
jgi:tetratricopeptide (TPR) repeat protein